MSTILIKRFIVLFLLMLPTHGFLQNRVIVNEGVIANLLVPKALENIVKTISADQRIQIMANQNNEADHWLAQILTDSCLERNYLVYSSRDSATETDFVIKIADVKVAITYHPTGKKLLIFNKGFRRSVTAEFRLLIREQNSRIRVDKKIKNNYTDILSASSLGSVENKEKFFTIGTKKQSTFINRWLEPVIITAATASVVFLFYSLRSDN